MTKARELADVIGTQSTTENVLQGRRNLIINGDFKVSQRGDYTSATSVTSGNFYVDRWKVNNSLVTSTIQHTDVTINGVSKKALKQTATSSGTGYLGIHQRIELQNIPVGETVTASCWVRSNNPNTRFRTNQFRGSTVNTDGTAFTNDGNWEKVSWTFDTTGTTSNPTIWVITYDGATVSVTSGDYIEIADFQLEVGSVATPFEHRSYGEELALCQRYYSTIETNVQGYPPINGYAHSNLYFPSTMRATPSVSYSGSGQGGTIQGFYNVTKHNARLEMRSTSGGRMFALGVVITADAEL